MASDRRQTAFATSQHLICRSFHRATATPFDIPGVAFSHQGEYCTFDSMTEDSGPQDEALHRRQRNLAREAAR